MRHESLGSSPQQPTWLDGLWTSPRGATKRILRRLWMGDKVSVAERYARACQLMRAGRLEIGDRWFGGLKRGLQVREIPAHGLAALGVY